MIVNIASAMFTHLADISRCCNKQSSRECCPIFFCGSFGKEPTLFIKDCTNTLYAYDIKTKVLYQLRTWTEIFPIYSMICDRNNNLYLLTGANIFRISRVDTTLWFSQRLVSRLSIERPWPEYFVDDTEGNIYVSQEGKTLRCIFGESGVIFEPATLMTYPPDIIQRFYQAGGSKCVTYPGLEEPEITCYEENTILIRFFHSKWRCTIARWDGHILTILTPSFPFRCRKMYIDPREMTIYFVNMKVGEIHDLQSYRYGVKSLLTLSLEMIQHVPNWQHTATTLPVELRERLHVN